jgi:UPF0755 protein
MIKIAIGFICLAILAVSIYFINPFAPPSKSEKSEIVYLNSTSGDSVALKLEEDGFIKSFSAFNIIYSLNGSPKIEKGGYYLSKNMNAMQILNELKQGADLKEVVIKEGIRKEEIGERLGNSLGWSESELETWNNLYKNSDEYFEGVYFPDTYLIPVDETPKQVADRMIRNFNDKFAPYSKGFEEQDVKWTTAIKMASLLEREAAGSHDMPLIAGIMWNRLLDNHKLDIDATIQYAKGKVDGKWWSRVTGEDIRNIDSPYNTYKYKGLPPTPIANPGIAAIEAVLNPEETDCYYYLHSHGQIYCSETYEEHMENIEKYL